ncbi:hypothetical protein SKAU_G00110590 [Synaphobranchus kaupii]|uniref:Uncharacterized protein n=1 Tax=Synaphobranchus kaupii TaxID=118154 RepID=A0A9Q1G1H0_SYNKA|nr:hypothetical protein SKAU_G00110590 [Synaphobranchus kaupii]
MASSWLALPQNKRTDKDRDLSANQHLHTAAAPRDFSLHFQGNLLRRCGFGSLRLPTWGGQGGGLRRRGP